ncbi:uncharacterized protein LOC143212793 isoform X3 [Lasioglossum baleicum]|uniref:uncharacterized protein LOC143212793 isoform X3 n=1 Tax=Lasioglossum baleicum TaxID=434251 RepID=UPI003FCCC246
MGRKRGRSVTDKDNKAPKRARMDVNAASNEDLESSSDLQDKPEQDELHNAYQTNQYRNHFPHHLIGLMYQLDLSVLCSLRKSIYEDKYTSLSLAFGSSETDKFSNIVLRYKEKSIHIQIENVDKYYIDNCISYAKLFTREKEKRSFFINDYFDSFVKHLISKLDGSLNNIEYFIIYTNSGLGLTEEKTLKKGRSWSFYPFKFDSINMEECDILKDFLFTNDNTKGSGFYRFLQDKTTREEFSKRLEFSSAVQKEIKERKLSQEEIKEAFLDKLVFAVNQPNREELNSIIKNEIEKNSKVQDDYIALQKGVLRDLTATEKDKKLGNYIPGIIYEFNLLMSFLHDMFLHKNIFSINSESHGISNDITINYKDRITYIKAHNADSNIGHSQLFPSRKHTFSINKYLTLFVEELKEDTKYFIIYTNADLDLTEEKKLKQGSSKDFYPLKFDSIDIQKKEYKILRDCSCINENGLYQFAQKKTTRKKLLSLLKLPSSLQKEEGSFSNENEKEIKEKFLDKLIFAVNQPNKEKLNSIIKNEIERNDESNKVPYNYEELYEIALRWLESHEFGPITKGIMEKLLGDIKNNRSSYQEIQNKDINEEIKFAKSVVGREGTPAFYQFLGFLIKGEGIKYLEVLKGKGINLPNMSSILNRAGTNAAKAFKDLYDLWFDAKGNKTQYLKTLEDEGVNLPNMSSILNGAGTNAAKAFKDLYDLWFDTKGNKTQYLKTLKKEGVNLPNMSSILGGAGTNAAEAFKDLYDLWFDAKGNKTQYLKTLEDEGVNLPNMSSILGGAGTNAAKVFKDLYDLWFDTKGNKTQYLKTLKKEGVNLLNMSSILSGAGVKSPKAFKDLYDLWFDAKGNKTQYLKTLEDEGVNLSNMSSILGRAAANAAKAFKDLYDLWFDAEGEKTQYLKTLEKEGINLTNISSILHGAAANAAKASKDLYNLWFDVEGKKKQHLKHFIKKKNEEKSFTIHNLSSILNGAGANVKDAFEKLHSICFNNKGKRTGLLDDFYNADFEPSNLSCILCGTGARASSILKRLHSVCFDDEGKRTGLLDDFYNAGFRPGDLCNILSAAADSLKEFHDFCFTGETKKYLNHFLNEKEGFTLSNLSDILHGTRANICPVLKDFHDVCFDETGNKTQLLDYFYNAGFRSDDLSNILSMAGNNAASILRNFHKLCFSKENYLDHFLAEEELFTPKDLSRILRGVGMNICSIFEKLHDLCFDKSGNRTDYLDSLIKNRPSNKILDVLYERVRKAPSTFLNDIPFQQQDISIVEESKMEYDDEEEYMGSGSQDKSSKKQKVYKKSLQKSLQQSNSSSHKRKVEEIDSSQQKRNLRKRIKGKAQIQSGYSDKKQQEAFLRLSEFISSYYSPNISIESVRQGLYFPSFEERGIKIDGKCTAITRSLSQALLLQSDKSFLSNLETSAEIYERIAQGKQVSKREEREVFAFSKLLDSFERKLDSSTSSLPLNLIHTKGYKTFSDLSNYTARIEGDFAIHLVTSNHVVAIYRIGNDYAYFDSNTAFGSGLKSVDQLMKVVEKAVMFAGYKVGEKGFLVEHFDVDKANSQLSNEDKQILAKEIKTERQLLAEQDKELGFIKINGQELSRVQLYDFGTKINVEGGVPLLINADMNLNSKKSQDHLDKKEVQNVKLKKQSKHASQNNLY